MPHAAADDADLEARLAVLRKGKGATPDGEGAKAKKRVAADGGKAAEGAHAMHSCTGVARACNAGPRS